MKCSGTQTITENMISIAFCQLFCRITTTGTGSTCSAAYDNAIKLREAEFNSNYTKYCNCNTGSWSANIGLNKSCGGIFDVLTSIPYQMNYDNECGGSKSVSMSWSCTKSTNTGGGSASGSVTISIPSGSGHTTGSASLGGTECTCTTLTFTSSGVKSGSC